MDVTELLESLGIFAIAAAGLGFLAKSLLSHLFSKDLDDHKNRLTRELEAFKAEMGRELQEHSVRFSTLHTLRVEAVKELMTMIHGIKTDEAAYVMLREIYQQQNAFDNQVWLTIGARVKDRLNDLRNAHESHRAGLPTEVSFLLGKFAITVFDIYFYYDQFRLDAESRIAGGPSNEDLLVKNIQPVLTRFSAEVAELETALASLLDSSKKPLTSPLH